jgi:hypothetical protein
VRFLPPEPHAPVVEREMTPGPQPGSCGFESRRGYQTGRREEAIPPASGAGDRRFDSCQPDLRGRGEAVLASLMSSRPWVRIPPALLLSKNGGRRAAEEVTEQGLVQSAGPNVQLTSISLQGRPVRRWRRGHALAGAPMGNSWLRSRPDGDVSVSGCGEPIPPSVLLLGGVAQTSRALACQARGRRFESGRPRFVVAVV